MSEFAATALRRSVGPLALMAWVFFWSAQPNLHTDLGLIDTIGRKLIHLVTYGVLAALWVWALRPALPGRSALVVAASVSLAYAISDEYHQGFVDGRNGTSVDVVIDAAGIGLGLWLLRRRAPS